MTSFSLEQIANHLGGTLHGEPDVKVEKIATLANANSTCIGFLANSKYKKQLDDTKAAAVLIHPNDLEYLTQHSQAAGIVLNNPYLAYAKLAQLMDTTPKQNSGIAPSAVVDSSAQIAANASIGANAVIAANVVIEDSAVIGANCFVGERTVIGSGTRLWANVSVYHDVSIGENCLVQSGTVIGSDGFGYAPDGKQWVKIPQLGGVRIGNNVEIGANTCIDRGALDDTVIGNGVIIDNLCQIAHNVEIGDNVAMAGASGVAGSSKVGNNVSLAGKAGIAGHINVCDGAVIAANTIVTNDIKAPDMYSTCVSAMPAKEWRRVHARIRQLDDSHKRLRQNEKAIDALSAKLEQSDQD